MECGLGSSWGDCSQDPESHGKEGTSRIRSVASTERTLSYLWEGTVIGASRQPSQSRPLCLSHSRIEWVWLHWSEYLLAQDEFYRWFQKMVVTLEPPVELQLGLKEKQWQLSHAQVLLHNVDNQAVLLDRLLEEAGSLFSRIGDPSVDEDAQKRMKAEYDAVKARAQVSQWWMAPLLKHLPTHIGPCSPLQLTQGQPIHHPLSTQPPGLSAPFPEVLSSVPLPTPPPSLHTLPLQSTWSLIHQSSTPLELIYLPQSIAAPHHQPGSPSSLHLLSPSTAALVLIPILLPIPPPHPGCAF